MRFFRRSERNEQITCPSCCQLIAADAQSCDMCGADLSELTAEQRESRVQTGALSGSGSPYAR